MFLRKLKKTLPPVIFFVFLHACGDSPNSSAESVIAAGTPVTDVTDSTQNNTSVEHLITTEEPLVGGALPGDNSELISELISIDSLSFVGAFSLPVAQDNISSLNYSAGIIEVNDDSLFITGHNHDDAIAEFTIPELVASTTIAELNSAGAPRQRFVKVLDRAAFGNPESLDEIVGMELVDNSLVINAMEYYDGPGDNQLSTLVINNALDLQNSEASAFLSMQGHARAAGWLSTIPEHWQLTLGATHISGHSSGTPIINRHSVGPSAFAVDLGSVITSDNESTIPTTELLGFSLEKPLDDDLFNSTSQNKSWTHISRAKFGFIVPGTSTYMVLGWSGGHQSGVGYKITQNDGTLCGGYCSNNADDNRNSYWLWDINDLIKAKNGFLSPQSIRPYAFGQLDLPFQGSGQSNRQGNGQSNGNLHSIGGASYDSAQELLYISLLGANHELGEYNNPPIIVAYKINAEL